MRSKLRNSPIWMLTSTMEKTMPTTVAMNRNRSCSKFRDAILMISDMDIQPRGFMLLSNTV